MNELQLLVGVVALIFGIISEVEGRARNWAGWGVIVIAAWLIYTALK